MTIQKSSFKDNLAVYLDEASTTPVHPEVVEAMLPFFSKYFGNPSSNSHSAGWDARAAVEQARDSILRHLNAPSGTQLVFTSGATESCNLAILGTSNYLQAGHCHLVTQPTEHRCVLATMAFQAKHGFRHTLVPTDHDGKVSLSKLRGALKDKTNLVSIMAVNNEIGTIQPTLEIAHLVHKEGDSLFHTDATQAIGKIAFDMQKLEIDLLSLSAHKIYGPKGIGTLLVAPRAKERIVPIVHGGLQEFGLRAGTPNVPAIVGFAKALELAIKHLDSSSRKIEVLRQRLLSELRNSGINFHLNGHQSSRVAGTLSISFTGVSAADLISALPEIAMSRGSACDSSEAELSHVLKAIGLSDSVARSTIRLSFGAEITFEQIDFAVSRIKNAIHAMHQTV